MSKQSAVQRQASLHHIACHDISDYEIKHDFGFNIVGLQPPTSRHKGPTSNITIPNPPSPLLRASDGSPGTDLDPTPSTLYPHYPNPGCVAVVSIPSLAPPSIKPATNTPAAHLARGVRMDVPGGRAVAPRNGRLCRSPGVRHSVRARSLCGGRHRTSEILQVRWVEETLAVGLMWGCGCSDVFLRAWAGCSGGLGSPVGRGLMRRTMMWFWCSNNGLTTVNDQQRFATWSELAYMHRVRRKRYKTQFTTCIYRPDEYVPAHISPVAGLVAIRVEQTGPGDTPGGILCLRVGRGGDWG